MIFGGVTPTTESLEIILNKELGVDYFLERRELGVINIGGPGFIEIDGRKEAMKKQDGYYVGKETRQVISLQKMQLILRNFTLVLLRRITSTQM